MFTCQLIEEVGFVEVQSEDRTDQFVDTLVRELQRFEDNKEEFVKVNHHIDDLLSDASLRRVNCPVHSRRKIPDIRNIASSHLNAIQLALFYLAVCKSFLISIR